MKNEVIEVLTREHGKQVMQYWKDRGVDTLKYKGTETKAGGNNWRYYGVINGEFAPHSLDTVKRSRAEIIELPLGYYSIPIF